MKLYETTTHLPPEEVIGRARSFFARDRSINASSPGCDGRTHLRLYIEVGEIVIGAVSRDGATRVRGSASRGAGLLTSFLTALPRPDAPGRGTAAETPA